MTAKKTKKSAESSPASKRSKAGAKPASKKAKPASKKAKPGKKVESGTGTTRKTRRPAEGSSNKRPAPGGRAPEAAPDPFQTWRTWLDRAERQWNTAFNEAMESEAFSKGTGKVLDLLVAFQGSMNEATHRYFSILNVPTRSDILQLGERLHGIEERLAQIERSLGNLQRETGASRSGDTSRSAPRRKPRRTRRPPPAPDEERQS